MRTELNPTWDGAYEDLPDDLRQAQKGRIEVLLADGERLVEEIHDPHAHPLGRRPFGMVQAKENFRRLRADRVEAGEQARFLELVDRLSGLNAEAVRTMNVQSPTSLMSRG